MVRGVVLVRSGLVSGRRVDQALSEGVEVGGGCAGGPEAGVDVDLVEEPGDLGAGGVVEERPVVLLRLGP